MSNPRTDLAFEPAATIARLVQSREVHPREVVQACLARIESLDARFGAFQHVHGEVALADADRLASRRDLAELPLAGVPIAVKDNLEVADMPLRVGTRATPADPCGHDHETVRRLRGAGAIVIGKTRLPELGIWGTTESAFGITRNPWDPDRTPGGSSGGSAAAVAAGMVPIALGNDGMGSIRIPAAACGLFGIKPGSGLVPAALGTNSWFGLAENGPLATTVEDAALMLSVLAGAPSLSVTAPPERPLRIALSTRCPVPGVPLHDELRAAVLDAAQLLADAGHDVVPADPPHPLPFANALFARWFAGAATESRPFELKKLERRTVGHIRAGRVAERLGLVRERDASAWRERVTGFFARHDLLLSPCLAQLPIPAAPRNLQSWIGNIIANTRFAPFTAPWNLAGVPAASIPTGVGPSGMPLSVQFVAPAGQDALLLAIGRQLEALQPWPRHAPVRADEAVQRT